MKNCFLIVVLFSMVSCTNYRKITTQELKTIDGVDLVIPDDSNYKLVVNAAMGCPPCKVGLIEIVDSVNKDCLTIYALEDGDYPVDVVKEYYGNLTESVVFIPYSQIESNYLKTKIFPKYYLYDENNKLLWNARGGNELDIDLINSTVQCN